MYEIAESAPNTSLPTIQPTTRLPEIRDRAQFAVYRPRRVPPTIQLVARLLRILLVLKPRVDIPNQMVVVVVADHDLLDLAVLAHFAPEVLVEGVEVVLQLRGGHFVPGGVGGVLVQVGEEDGLGVRGFDVFAGAAVAVAAGADFVVEGAVYFVLFGAED